MEQKVYVFVQASDGSPMMPTTRYGKVRRMLNVGLAHVVMRKPFTIRLDYQPATDIRQPVYLGDDPGRTNIGLSAVRPDGECLYLAHAETRNKEVPGNMADRKSHRQASRRGERKRRKRRAKAAGTILLRFHDTAMGKRPEMCYDARQDRFYSCRNRYLPHYQEPVIPREISNTEAKFLNRRREPGWLTPTARQLLQTHVSLIRLVCQILPITGVVTEINRFAFMALENPKAKGIDFQNGHLKGFSGSKEAVCAMQNGKCLLCKKRSIDHYHHMRPRFRGGGDTVENYAGLCALCHEKVHKDIAAMEKLAKLHGSRNKKYGALSVLNRIIPYLIDEMANLFPDNNYVTTGYNTKIIRDSFGLDKEHELDAYCIAMSVLHETGADLSESFPEAYEIKQFRRHNRAIIGAQYERTYRLNGKVVAKNRHKRMAQADSAEKGQTSDSLEEWYQKQVDAYGVKEADRLRSQLTVRKSCRRYNDRDRLMPGAEFICNGERQIMRGQHNNGTRYYFVGQKKDCAASECKLVRKNNGLVYL